MSEPLESDRVPIIRLQDIEAINGPHHGGDQTPFASIETEHLDFNSDVKVANLFLERQSEEGFRSDQERGQKEKQAPASDS